MRSDAVAKRADILTAAWRLFSVSGAEVSLRTVGAEAGVGIGTLYRHFATREDLIVGLADEMRNRIVGVVRAHEPTWEDDPSGTWTAFVRDLAGLRLGSLVATVSGLGEDMRAVIADRTRELRGESLTAVDRMASRARDAGFLDPDVTTMQFHIGLAALTRPIPLLPEMELDDQHDWLVETYLRGTRPPS